MSKPESYTQVTMRDGNKQLTGWIDSRGAKVGARVSLPDLQNAIYTVTDVYAGDLNPEEMFSTRHRHRGWRASVDI